MVKINNSFIKKISQSEIALFVFLIMALGNLLTFLDNNDLGGIILFFIIGFLKKHYYKRTNFTFPKVKPERVFINQFIERTLTLTS